MSKDASFDIVSEFDQQELVNAIDQASREINTRFDLKDTGASIETEADKAIHINASDEFAAKNIYDILEAKVVKRGLSPLILDPQKVEAALGGKVKQAVNLRRGLNQETAKKIVGRIKETKLKVQASIQGEQVRVSGKSRDDLQEAIAAVREFGDKQGLPLQFTNYR